MFLVLKRALVIVKLQVNCMLYVIIIKVIKAVDLKMIGN